MVLGSECVCVHRSTDGEWLFLVQLRLVEGEQPSRSLEQIDDERTLGKLWKTLIRDGKHQTMFALFNCTS